MIPRIRFANLPTPIEPMQRLSSFLGGPKLWIKRDDLTGLAFGGNKTRKLEFVFAEAMANGGKTLITVGGLQSNHCRQTAALAARFGLRCVLVLSGIMPEQFSGNLLLDRLFGAEIVWCLPEERDRVLQETFEREWESGHRPFLIPLGASTPTGTAGYVFAIEELIQQGAPPPDWIIVGSSSGGTQAGMVLGALRERIQTKILGISIDHEAFTLQQTVAKLASETSDRLNEEIVVHPEDVLVNSDYLGSGYGIMGELEVNAIRLFAKLEGIMLGPVYTGRAAGAMIDLIQKGFFQPNDHILFWHTGDTPALFAEPYASHFS
ncbi:MAG: D-cysteine desulfhydrase family protein [Anaerolineaceae bacterium]|nr:D-cysteine desulfhydrase family protein [Anaerolineaceae bacterium]